MIARLVPWRYLLPMASQRSAKVVAIVDDDESVRSALLSTMKAADLRARAFASAEEYLESEEQDETGCLIADIRMPGMSGLELQARLEAEHRRIPILFISAHGDEEMRLRALRGGAVEFLAKPFDRKVLLDCVRAALGS
jgi:FixJ family two-component response regulator